ncbi:hypothetical protein D1970_20065 [Mesobacillus zeae]|uniref:Uncharacterized protein n=1 Tax=Mesobacillus zeae TaxID=1917180 RepID=A0A398AZB3_9BACI|nr:hypothetical protein D1970_20065 [Mesobacillus zeae]
MKNIGTNEITIAILPIGYRPKGPTSHVFSMPTSLDGSGLSRFARWSVGLDVRIEMYSISESLYSVGCGSLSIQAVDE